jgi:hypothetical protein
MDSAVTKLLATEGTSKKELFETLKEIREADNSNRILGENSEAHLLQSRRYSRLAGLLEKDAE